MLSDSSQRRRAPRNSLHRLSSAPVKRAKDSRRRRPANPAAKRGDSSEQPSRWSAVLAGLLPIFFFWKTTGYGFLLDDRILFETSSSLNEPSAILRAFTTDVGALRHGAEAPLSSYYRPVFLALSNVYFSVVGPSTFGWHFAAVLLAGLAGLCAFGWLRRVGLHAPHALAASAVFSLHPSHVSSVAWVSGIQELLAAIFSLAALSTAVSYARGPASRTPQASRRLLFLSGLAFLCALLSKEVAVAGVLVLGALLIAPPSNGDSDSRKLERRRLKQVALLFAALLALYLAARWIVFGGLAQRFPTAPGPILSLASVPLVLVSYVSLLAFPTSFSIFRPERPVASFLMPEVYGSALTLAVFLIVATVAIRRRRDLWLPIAWFGIWLLPVLNVWALDPQWIVTDRYLFLPSLALPWLLALVLPRRAAGIVLWSLALLTGILTLRYSAIFESEKTFLVAMEKAEPTSPIVFAEKGRLLVKEGNLPAAREAYRRAIELDPYAPSALNNLGDLALQDNDFEAARTYYTRAVSKHGGGSRRFKTLVLALARARWPSEALRIARETAERWPDDFQIHVLIAALCQASGSTQDARIAFEKATRLRPSDPILLGGVEGLPERVGVPRVGAGGG